MVKKSSPDIYGLIGYPVKHSLSPLMHNAAFNTLEINAEYRLFEVEPAKLETFLIDNIKILDTQGKEFYSQDISGFNITIPHKVRAFEILKKKFPLSFSKLAQEDQHYVKLSGAVNTVKREGGLVLYWNTDAAGFLKSLEDKEEGWGLGFATKGKSALVIGSGGAGRAVVAALSWKNMGIKKIYINDIDGNALKATQGYFFSLSEREDLKDRLDFISDSKIPEVIKKCDLLVNASPVGMKGEDASAVDRDWLHQDLCVYDVVYNREQETRLIRDAKSKGLRTANGLSMLLYQGADAFRLWTGREAPVEIMRKALNEGASGYEGVIPPHKMR